MIAIPRDPRHDILFESVRVGPKTLPNRFYQVPHCTGYGTHKALTNARFRGTKAEGGWGGVCTEWATISPESDESPAGAASLWDDEDAAALALVCTEVQRHGALAGIELVHVGGLAYQGDSRARRLGASQVATNYRLRYVPKAMERRDIKRVQAQWARAACRARDIGFDIVYVYAGDSYLPMQFLSPFYNKRTDEYGGAFENRARFTLETLERVRDAVGADCAIAVRISVDALGPTGVTLDEGLQFVRTADDLVDLWDVKVGGTPGPVSDLGTSRFFPENGQFQWTKRVREATQKPIVGVGRLTNPDTMAENIRSGAWDLVGAARPSIADPFLPRKIEEGRYDEIRECIGSNHCIASYRTGHLGCSQNATAGEEFRRGWHPERFAPAAGASRDVLVVGAGPAGMECAIVLGKRGFRRVHVVDAEPEVGGALRWISTLPGLGEWARIINWRRIQLEKLRNVEVLTGLRLSAADIREYGAEVVVVATGAYWAPDGLHPATHEPIPGADAALPHVLTPEQLMSEGKQPPGGRLLVYDCEGDFTAVGVAEKLALDGCDVELATALRDIAPDELHPQDGALLRRRLHELGVRMRCGIMLERIEPGRAHCTDEFGEAHVLEVDAVVLVTQRLSNEALYLELADDAEALTTEGVEALYRIGDCSAPGRIADAVFDGHRLAREIDSDDPSVPLPFLRERMVVSSPAVVTAS